MESQKFNNILECAKLQRIYPVTQAVKLPIVVSNIAVVGALTRCALVHTRRHLKA